MSNGSLDQARAAKQHALEVFSRFGEVVGVGLVRLDGGYGVKVNLKHAPSPAEVLPTTVDGVPVTVEVVGPLRKR